LLVCSVWCMSRVRLVSRLFPYTTLFRSEGELVVEVLIPAGDGDDPLGQQGALVVDDQLRQPGVGDRLVEGPEEPEPLFELAEQQDRKSTRLNSSHVKISYAVFCLKKKKT